MPQMPQNYYDRFDPADEYDEHLFIGGNGIQSAEFNEIQRRSAYKIKGIADALFKDGDIVRDASVLVDSGTGNVTCDSGAVYISGSVRGLAPASFVVPTTGSIAVGVRLIESVVTSLGDPDLVDPATGTRNYGMEGAARLKVQAIWGWSGDGGLGDFYPVYAVVDGILSAKEPPPSLDSTMQALARYDRDSAGGSYVVSGLSVKAQVDDGLGNQVYSLGEGRGRVYGYPIELATSRRLLYPAVPDLRMVSSEPTLSATASAQRVDLDFTPINDIVSVTITKQKTASIVHSVVTGGSDPLPDTSVLAIISVTQGATTYVSPADYTLTGNSVDWAATGAEPAPGSSYDVTYQYITTVAPTGVDEAGFTVTGAVVGTLILTTYNYRLPRIDRLALNQDGQAVWIIGVSAPYNPQAPQVPESVLPIASVYQTWTVDRSVTSDGIRVVPMQELASIEGRIDMVIDLLAQQRLQSSVHTRESGAKKGILTDPFLNDSVRDAGQAQGAAIVAGELVLPIAATVLAPDSDVLIPTALPYTQSPVLSQTLKTGSMKINPYQAFDIEPAVAVLFPSIDRWTDTVETWPGSRTSRFLVSSGNLADNSGSIRHVILSDSTIPAETLRVISVAFSVSGFGPAEALTTLTFDGINVNPGGLVANGSGVVSGSFTIPANVPTGTKEVRFVGGGGSVAEATFTGHGTVQRIELRNKNRRTSWRSVGRPRAQVKRKIDPLAQTFTLETTGQRSGVDIWFAAAPTTDAIVQIRETTVGFPTQVIVAETRLAPGSINIGGASTRFTFPEPVLLLGGTEYALVVLCNDAVGALSVAELGKFDATAGKWVTSQPYTVGVLLSSSNASTWTAHQDRDLAFQILAPTYTQSSLVVDLGDVTVSGATDILLMSYAEMPSSATSVVYTLTMPDLTELSVSDGQPVQLASAVTGVINIKATLSGNAGFSPVLHPGTQLSSGTVSGAADYITRAFVAGTGVTVKVVFEAIIPSGATVGVSYKGVDGGDVYAAVTAVGNTPADNGFTEFSFALASVTETLVHIKLALTGTSAARPRIRDLRATTV